MALRKSWGKLEHLTESVSPVSLFFVGLTAIPMLAVLLNPTPVEVLLWIGGEFVGQLIFPFWDPPLYHWYSPGSRALFPSPDRAVLATSSLAERTRLFQEMVSFPRNRYRYSWFASWLKVLLPWLAIVCLWDYSIPWTSQLGRVVLWSTLNFFCFNAMIFFESHEYMSNLIAELHRKYDWSDVFRKVSWTEPERDYSITEATLLLGSLAHLFIAQWIIVRTHVGTLDELATKLLFVGTTALITVGRIWYVARRYNVGALRAIVESLEGEDLRHTHGTLPLHSTLALARFEQTLNSLSERLRAHERELSNWISTRTEEQRFLALAEISALVVHDLSSPLQGVRLAADQLAGSRHQLNDPACLDRIIVGSSRCLELVQSLRAYLKASSPAERGASFGEVHGYVMRILSTRYPEREFGRIWCGVQPDLARLVLHISRADLIHILVNLVANSLENLMANGVKSPEVRLNLASIDGELASISIQDNGSGLTPERFEELTGFALLVPRQTGRQSLGLRLVRRLVERNSGDLTVKPMPAGDAGTCFLLKLPVAAEQSVPAVAAGSPFALPANPFRET